jgi:hypothetical protein
MTEEGLAIQMEMDVIANPNAIGPDIHKFELAHDTLFDIQGELAARGY